LQGKQGDGSRKSVVARLRGKHYLNTVAFLMEKWKVTAKPDDSCSQTRF
jgi:hypothetical protein